MINKRRQKGKTLSGGRSSRQMVNKKLRLEERDKGFEFKFKVIKAIRMLGFKHL